MQRTAWGKLTTAAKFTKLFLKLLNQTFFVYYFISTSYQINKWAIDNFTDYKLVFFNIEISEKIMHINEQHLSSFMKYNNDTSTTAI